MNEAVVSSRPSLGSGRKRVVHILDRRGVAALIGATLLSFVAGCASTRSRVEAPSAAYPVSLSPSVRDASGLIVSDDELEVVGAFTHSHTTVHMLLGLIPLSRGRFDLSAEINEQVAGNRGQAIVNLEIGDYDNGWNSWSGFPFLGVLPSYNKVEVRGDIVRLVDRRGQ